MRFNVGDRVRIVKSTIEYHRRQVVEVVACRRHENEDMNEYDVEYRGERLTFREYQLQSLQPRLDSRHDPSSRGFDRKTSLG